MLSNHGKRQLSIPLVSVQSVFEADHFGITTNHPSLEDIFMHE
ncbi:hypothetical protein ACMGD3_00695 [Lysinibacillus sphaericus]